MRPRQVRFSLLLKKIVLKIALPFLRSPNLVGPRSIVLKGKAVDICAQLKYNCSPNELFYRAMHITVLFVGVLVGIGKLG